MRVNVSTLCIHNPAGCFGLGFLWNVVPRVCGRELVIRRGKRGADGLEFGSCDKGNPRVSKCRIISARTLSLASRLRAFRAWWPSPRSRGRMRAISYRERSRSSFAAGLSFWSYAAGQLLSCRWISREEIHTARLYSPAWQAQNRGII